MTLEALLALLDYHYWARDRLLDAVEKIAPDHFRKDMGNSFPSIRDTLLHIVFSEWVWRLRWEGEPLPPFFDPKDFEAAQDIRERWIEEERHVRRVVDQVGQDEQNGLDHAFRYAELDGQETQSVFWQSVQHVVNHAAYHRGQVTAMMRQLGNPPPDSQDLIAFYRL